jgi:hypothetical protein
LNDIVKVDKNQHLFLTFKVLNALTNRALLIRQPFVRLTHITKQDLSNNFMAHPENKIYRFHLSAVNAATLFSNHSGEYTLEVVIGDPYIENSFVWNLGKVHFTFAGTPSSQARPLLSYLRKNHSHFKMLKSKNE